MKRREFITLLFSSLLFSSLLFSSLLFSSLLFSSLLGGAAASWLLAAPAQQADRVRRIGVLMNKAADDSEARSEVSAFAQQDPCTD
jgi:hypothetical protein